MGITTGDNRDFEVVTTFLEMLDPSQFCPAARTELSVLEAEVASPELNRFLYTAVGGPWHWTVRLDWTYEQWLRYLSRDNLRTWVGYSQGTPAGYFEMEIIDRQVEICSFGLIPQFVGQGLGGDLLSEAVRTAWSIGASRVWLHTCNLDSPAGLKNYLARGFKICGVERMRALVPIESPGPWPASGVRTRALGDDSP